MHPLILQTFFTLQVSSKAPRPYKNHGFLMVPNKQLKIATPNKKCVGWSQLQLQNVDVVFTQILTLFSDGTTEHMESRETYLRTLGWCQLRNPNKILTATAEPRGLHLTRVEPMR